VKLPRSGSSKPMFNSKSWARSVGRVICDMRRGNVNKPRRPSHPACTHHVYTSRGCVRWLEIYASDLPVMGPIMGSQPNRLIPDLDAPEKKSPPRVAAASSGALGAFSHSQCAAGEKCVEKRQLPRGVRSLTRQAEWDALHHPFVAATNTHALSGIERGKSFSTSHPRGEVGKCFPLHRNSCKVCYITH
jgi:hypothetical protein